VRHKFRVAFQRRAELKGDVARHEIQEDIRLTIGAEANRQFVREVPHGFGVFRAKRERRQIRSRDAMGQRKVRELAAFRGQPAAVAIGQHRVEHHQALDGPWQRGGPSVATVG
jgi:hypothetical protein